MRNLAKSKFLPFSEMIVGIDECQGHGDMGLITSLKLNEQADPSPQLEPWF